MLYSHIGIQNELDAHKEITPMCVLDFYVHESKQRTGRGKMLFEAMLEVCETERRKGVEGQAVVGCED